MIRLQIAAWSDVGQERELNEDRVFYQVLELSDADPVGVCIVADGMGGQVGGEVASHWAVETLKRELADLFMPSDPRQTLQINGAGARAMIAEAGGKVRPSDTFLINRLRTAVERANQAVRSYTFHRPQEAMGAGSTVTMALLMGRRAYVANVGDSRTYMLRQGQIVQLTRDHSVVAELIAAGRISVQESFNHSRSGMITRCLGCLDYIEVDIEPYVLEADDVLLLCSDGLWTMVRDPLEMAQIITAAPSLEVAAAHLIDAANRAGGHDNISVGLVQLLVKPDIPM